MDRKLSGFKTDMKGAQEEAAAKAASCALRRKMPCNFKKKADEEQATFNDKVRYVVQEACDALAEVEVSQDPEGKSCAARRCGSFS